MSIGRRARGSILAIEARLAALESRTPAPVDDPVTAERMREQDAEIESLKSALVDASRLCDKLGCCAAVVRRDDGVRECAAGHASRWVDRAEVARVTADRDATIAALRSSLAARDAAIDQRDGWLAEVTGERDAAVAKVAAMEAPVAWMAVSASGRGCIAFAREAVEQQVADRGYPDGDRETVVYTPLVAVGGVALPAGAVGDEELAEAYIAAYEGEGARGAHVGPTRARRLAGIAAVRKLLTQPAPVEPARDAPVAAVGGTEWKRIFGTYIDQRIVGPYALDADADEWAASVKGAEDGAERVVASGEAVGHEATRAAADAWATEQHAALGRDLFGKGARFIAEAQRIGPFPDGQMTAGAPARVRPTICCWPSCTTPADPRWFVSSRPACDGHGGLALPDIDEAVDALLAATAKEPA